RRARASSVSLASAGQGRARASGKRSCSGRGISPPTTPSALAHSIAPALHARFPEARALDWPPEAKTSDEARTLLDRGSAIITADAFDALRERRRKRVFY
ncbi:MAG TPA: hypothetical protein VHB97_08350, partial [Polyangia bacterium]|nr:hypothetical protein [Polyangia bacterium]